MYVGVSKCGKSVNCMPHTEHRCSGSWELSKEPGTSFNVAIFQLMALWVILKLSEIVVFFEKKIGM